MNIFEVEIEHFCDYTNECGLSVHSIKYSAWYMNVMLTGFLEYNSESCRRLFSNLFNTNHSPCIIFLSIVSQLHHYYVHTWVVGILYQINQLNIILNAVLSKIW